MPTPFGDIPDLEPRLLAHFFCVGKHWRDRSAQGLVEHVNELSGLPESAAALLPRHRALQGDQLALNWTPVPSNLAGNWLRYHAANDLVCSLTATCDGCRVLELKPKSAWDDDEVRVHADLTYAIKLAAMRLAERGLIDSRPIDHEGSRMPLGEDGLPMRFGITPEGLKEAAKIVAADPTLDQKLGWENAVMRSELAKLPGWYGK